MIKVKTITSKSQTDFENRIERFLKSVSDMYGYVESMHYSIAIEGKDIYRSVMITYYEEDLRI